VKSDKSCRPLTRRAPVLSLDTDKYEPHSSSRSVGANRHREELFTFRLGENGSGMSVSLWRIRLGCSGCLTCFLNDPASGFGVSKVAEMRERLCCGETTQ
jgi:hypothetical protein